MHDFLVCPLASIETSILLGLMKQFMGWIQLRTWKISVSHFIIICSINDDSNTIHLFDSFYRPILR